MGLARLAGPLPARAGGLRPRAPDAARGGRRAGARVARDRGRPGMKLIPRTRRGALLRYGLGALIVVALTATATAVAGLLQFNEFAKDLSLNPAIKQANTTV